MPRMRKPWLHVRKLSAMVAAPVVSSLCRKLQHTLCYGTATRQRVPCECDCHGIRT